MTFSPIEQFQREAAKPLDKARKALGREQLVDELRSTIQNNLNATSSFTFLGHVSASVEPGSGIIHISCDRVAGDHQSFAEKFHDYYRTYARRSRILETFPSPPVMGISLDLPIFPISGPLSGFSALQTQARIKLLGKEAFFDSQWLIVARAVARLDARLRDAGGPARQLQPSSGEIEPRHREIFAKAMAENASSAKRSDARAEVSERVFAAISANLAALCASEMICFVRIAATHHGDGRISVRSVGGASKYPGGEPDPHASFADFSHEIDLFPPNRRIPVLSRSVQDLRRRLVNTDKIIDREWRRLARAIAVADENLCHVQRWPRRGALTSSAERSQIEEALSLPSAPSRRASRSL